MCFEVQMFKSLTQAKALADLVEKKAAALNVD